uniref:HDC03674 n=1 Tax=Drosophila melanogaster TaxID=7227 RepID=Q6IH14_DROME|nr:TPA_inf: HDC03674 [Drosophila melanogaster]
MVKIAELKAVVAFLLRDRNLGVAGFRAELLQRLVEQVRLKNYMNQSKPREARFLATDEICQAAQVMRLGTSNQDKLFTRMIYINDNGYNAFIDTGRYNSQISIISKIRKSIADEIDRSAS